MNNFDGYAENETATNARAWRIALSGEDYYCSPMFSLNTETEADALHALIVKAANDTEHAETEAVLDALATSPLFGQPPIV